MKNGKCNVDSFTGSKKQRLYDYLDKNLMKNENGKLETLDSKAD